MPKKILLIILFVLFGLVAVYGAYYFIQKANTPTILPESNKMVDPLNTTYYVDNRPIGLVNGRYEEGAVSGSATKTQYYVWEKPSYGDLNGDGVNDAVTVIVNDNGGSGSFYYLVAALRKSNSTVTAGTNGSLLGDRITIRDISIKDKEVAVDYLDRRIGEPIAASPSIEMSLKFIVKDGMLIQIPNVTSDGQNCVKYGGEVKSSLCCQSVEDFPNSCMIGACGCSPVNSHQIQICDCGEGKCFDGNQCVKVK